MLYEPEPGTLHVADYSLLYVEGDLAAPVTATKYGFCRSGRELLARVCTAPDGAFGESYISLHGVSIEAKELRDRQGGSITGMRAIPVSIPYATWDFDGPTLAEALRNVRILASVLVDQFALRYGADFAVFFSGNKGYHLQIPTAGWLKQDPIVGNAGRHRRFCEHLAGLAEVQSDLGIYQPGRFFRLPNSWHPQSNLAKVYLDEETFMDYDEEYHRDCAKEACPFAMPMAIENQDARAALRKAWQDAQSVSMIIDGEGERAHWEDETRAPAPGRARLRKATEDFLTAGAAQGQRNAALFAAAADIASMIMKATSCTAGQAEQLTGAILHRSAERAGMPYAECQKTIDSAVQRAKQELTDGRA